jgi:hypothetical protein
MEISERIEAPDAAGEVKTSEMHRLEMTLEALTLSIEQLEASLETVLDPPTPEAVLESKRPPRSRLGDRIDRLEDLTHRLHYLRGRISL